MSRDSTIAISVIVPVRNAEAHLAEALGSIAAQSRLPDEVVIVEGGSTDRSANIARDFAQACSPSMCVHVVEQCGRGLAAARNQGVRVANGTHIAFLDADDVWARHKLAAQAEQLRAHGDDCIIIGHMRRFANRGAPLERRFDDVAMSRPAAALTPGGMLAARACFERVGPFAESFRIGCDTDWFARARDAGVPLLVLPDVVLHKRIHDRALSSDAARYRRELVSIVWQSRLRRARR